MQNQKQANPDCNTCRHRYTEYNSEASWCECDFGHQPYHTDCGMYDEGNSMRSIRVMEGV